MSYGQGMFAVLCNVWVQCRTINDSYCQDVSVQNYSGDN